MSKKTPLVIAAVLLVLVAGFFVFNGRNTTSSGGLTVITQSNIESELQNTDKPVLLLITGNCAECPAVLEAFTKESAKYPDVKFAVADADDLGAPAEALPGIIAALPQVGPTSQKTQVTSAEVAGYVAQRVNVATKQMAALKKVTDLQKEIESKGKPFDDQLAEIKTRYEAAVQPIKERHDAAMAPVQAEAAALNDRIKTALGTLPQELQAAGQAQDEAAFNRIRAEINKRLEPFKAESDAIKAKLAATAKPFRDEAATVMKPFQDEAAAVSEKRSAALGTLEEDFGAAQSEFMGLVLMDQLGVTDQPEAAPEPAPAQKG